MLRASGVTSDFTYDRASRVKTIVHDSPSAGVLESLAYDYNPSGTIHDMTDHNGLHVFGYDRTYQLTSVDYPDASPFPDITYSYDGAGNRTSTVTASGTVTYVANALNEYTSVGGVSQTYDANGNLTSDGTNTYTFDAENRLVSASTTAGPMTYAYDPFKRRVRKSNLSTGTTKTYVWAQNDLSIEYDSGNGQNTKYFNDGPSSVTKLISEPSGVSSDLLDGVPGAPRVGTDPVGGIVWRSQYEAFGGDALDPTNSIEVALRLPGQYNDPDSRLHYNRSRYYNPRIGRYLELDPIQTIGAHSKYSYANNNPISLIDPLGLLAYQHHIGVTTVALGSDIESYPNLPVEVANVDWLPGSQAPENAYWHAMRDGTNGQTVEEARALYEKYVQDQIAKCTEEGLARALHAVEDKPAGGHRGFQPWSGGLPGPVHGTEDNFPSPAIIEEATQNARDVLERYKERCGMCRTQEK